MLRRLVPILALVAACSTSVATGPEERSEPEGYDQPVNLAVNDETIWVVERGGRVVSVEGEVLLDLELDLEGANHETGLLSVEFWDGGYWLYVAWPQNGVSELWSLPPRANGLAAGHLVRRWGPAPWHYGGGMELHGEWLYLGVGDGAAGAAHADHAQDLRPDRGAILRYSIETGAWEIAARGLRNPWTWTLHDDTFYIADVGAQDAEEINIAPEAPWDDQGAIPNFGWPVYEGSSCVVEGCELAEHVPPAIEYRNESGCSVVILGGILNGELVWGDWCSGDIHYTELDTLETETVATDLQPTSMIVHDDELWLTSFDGYVGPLVEGLERGKG